MEFATDRWIAPLWSDMFVGELVPGALDGTGPGLALLSGLAATSPTPLAGGQPGGLTIADLGSGNYNAYFFSGVNANEGFVMSITAVPFASP